MPISLGVSLPVFLLARKPTANSSVDESNNNVSGGSAIVLENLEEEETFDAALVKRLAKVIEVLPSAEI